MQCKLNCCTVTIWITHHRGNLDLFYRFTTPFNWIICQLKTKFFELFTSASIYFDRSLQNILWCSHIDYIIYTLRITICIFPSFHFLWGILSNLLPPPFDLKATDSRERPQRPSLQLAVMKFPQFEKLPTTCSYEILFNL
jgi:hypothetical protein